MFEPYLEKTKDGFFLHLFPSDTLDLTYEESVIVSFFTCYMAYKNNKFIGYKIEVPDGLEIEYNDSRLVISKPDAEEITVKTPTVPLDTFLHQDFFIHNVSDKRIILIVRRPLNLDLVNSEI